MTPTTKEGVVEPIVVCRCPKKTVHHGKLRNYRFAKCTGGHDCLDHHGIVKKVFPVYMIDEGEN